MADAVKLNTLVTLVAAQVIPVTNALGASVNLGIRDMRMSAEAPGTGLPLAVNAENCPLLVPRAADFITNVLPTFDTEGGNAAYKSLGYDLNYQLFFCPLLEGGSWPAFYGPSADCLMAVLVFFMDNGDQFSGQGNEDFKVGPARIWPQTDVLATGFHGGEIVFHVSHYLEV